MDGHSPWDEIEVSSSRHDLVDTGGGPPIEQPADLTPLLSNMAKEDGSSLSQQRERRKEAYRMQKVMDRSQNLRVSYNERWKRIRGSNLVIYIGSSYYSTMILLNLFVIFWEVFARKNAANNQLLFVLGVESFVTVCMIFEVLLKIVVDQRRYWKRLLSWADMFISISTVGGLAISLLFPDHEERHEFSVNLLRGIRDSIRVFAFIVFMKNMALLVFGQLGSKSASFLDFVDQHDKQQELSLDSVDINNLLADVGWNQPSLAAISSPSNNSNNSGGGGGGEIVGGSIGARGAIPVGITSTSSTSSPIRIVEYATPSSMHGIGVAGTLEADSFSPPPPPPQAETETREVR